MSILQKRFRHHERQVCDIGYRPQAATDRGDSVQRARRKLRGNLKNATAS